MPYYRLYFIDPDGAIDSVEEFSARDDVEAVRFSHDYARRRPAELWCRSRIVEMVQPIAERRPCLNAKRPGPGRDELVRPGPDRGAPRVKPIVSQKLGSRG